MTEKSTTEKSEILFNKLKREGDVWHKEVESITEKAAAIGQYFVASGVLVIFAKELFPYQGSDNVRNYLLDGIEKDFSGRWALESDPVKAAKLMLEHIESKRDALGINEAKERKLYSMEDRQALEV